MKLKVLVNFDFGALHSQMPKIIEKTMQRYARSAEMGSKEAIDKGVSPKLEESTIRRRKRRGTGGTKPLFETGTLYRSIKGTSEGLDMIGYGYLHHIGDVGQYLNMKKRREFITISKKQIMPTLDKFKKDIRIALRSNKSIA